MSTQYSFRIPILVGAIMLLSTGFLSGFWNDVMTIIAAVVVVGWASFVLPQQRGRFWDLKHWFQRRRQFKIDKPKKPWKATYDSEANALRPYGGIGKFGIRCNATMRIDEIKIHLKTEDGAIENSNFNQIIGACLASDSEECANGGDRIYYGGTGRLFDKNYKDEIEVHYDVQGDFKGQLELEIRFAGDGWWRGQRIPVPIAIESEGQPVPTPEQPPAS